VQARNTALEMLVHVADLANTAKPPRLSGEWSYRVVQGAWDQQGEREKRLQLESCIGR
jgi:hypothetical protein